MENRTKSHVKHVKPNLSGMGRQRTPELKLPVSRKINAKPQMANFQVPTSRLWKKVW